MKFEIAFPRSLTNSGSESFESNYTHLQPVLCFWQYSLWKIQLCSCFDEINLNNYTVLGFKKLATKELNNNFYMKSDTIRLINDTKILLPQSERLGPLKFKNDLILQEIAL